MTFIGQILLPTSLRAGDQQMAYIFMTDSPDVDGTWDPTLGENAVILQPAPFEPNVETESINDGPTVQTQVEHAPSFIGRLLGTQPSKVWEPVEYSIQEHDMEFREDCLSSRIGGQPSWLQYDETPDDGTWLFIVQIDSDTPFYVNFGDAGVGYAFIRDDGRSARFLWQCG